MKNILFLAFLLAVILPGKIFAVVGWNVQDGFGLYNFTDIASSSDGVKLVAVKVSSQSIYTSTDSGFSWTKRTGAGARNWRAVASSSDGTKLVAVATSANIFTSTDSGVTWTEQTGSGSRPWLSALASSSDGTKLIAGVGFNTTGYLYTSTDSGVTWTERTGAGSRRWASLASSADGTKLIAGGGAGSSSYLYTSTDSGVTWTERTGAGLRSWAVASSADGAKLVAAASSDYIYTSTDSGVNWTQQTTAGSRNWSSVASSDDGTTLIAGVSSGYIYISTDSGATWTEQTSAGSSVWSSLSSSTDATKIFAAGSSSARPHFWTYGDFTAPDIDTLPILFKSSTYASLRGDVVDAGGGAISEIGFEYGLTEAYGSTVSFNDRMVLAEEPFAFPATSLTCNTTYNYRAYAENSAGTSYGDNATFTTDACDSNPEVILYAVDGLGQNPDPNQLFILDPGSGRIIETIGAIGFITTGLAIHPETDILYGSVGNSDADAGALISINRETGVGTLLGIIQDADDAVQTMAGINFRSNGVLYGWSSNSNDLYTIDTASCDGLTCLATKVGESGLGGQSNGIAFDSLDNLYLFNAFTTFRKIDPDTGLSLATYTISGDYSQPQFPGADFDIDDNLYVSITHFGGDPAGLAIVDLVDYSIDSVLEGDNDQYLYMDPIAFFYPEQVVAEEEVLEETSIISSGSRKKIVRAEPTLTEPGNIPEEPLNCLPGYLYSPINGLQCPTNISTTPIPTTPPVCTLTQTLRQGSIGEEVKCLQTILKITSDGIFGPITRASVINFQTTKNLVPDGIVGPITRELVNGN